MKKNLFTNSAAICLCLSFFIQGCSTNRQSATFPFLASGSILISRPAPAISAKNPTNDAFGFIPLTREQENKTEKVQDDKITDKMIAVDLSKGTVTLKEKELTQDMKILSVNLAPGSKDYNVMHKQENPAWYANDDYFKNRELSVPGAFDRSRYLKGVLGEYAVYFAEDLSFHCSPYDNQEVHGIRLSPEDLGKLFAATKVGDKVSLK